MRDGVPASDPPGSEHGHPRGSGSGVLRGSTRTSRTYESDSYRSAASQETVSRRIFPGRGATAGAGQSPAKDTTVDLMEYQAKELFAKHYVPVTLGVVAETVAEARAAAEQMTG